MTPRTRAASALTAALSAVLTATLVAPAAPAAAATPAQQLQLALRQALSGSTARVVGAYVVVDGLGTVSHQAVRTALPPASVQKTFTGLTALLTLDPETRLVTRLTTTAPGVEPSGVLRGDLVVVAGGDPTLTTAHLRTLVDALSRAGVRHVTGDLRVDAGRYDDRTRAPGWKPSFVPGQSGALSAFMVDRNAWRRDAAYLAQPALGNLGRFRDHLGAARITLRGRLLAGAPPVPADTVLAEHASPPVRDLVRAAMKRSDNTISEMLLKEVGAAAGAGSTAGGAGVVRRAAQGLGVPVGAVADGSGLSALDRQSPLGVVTWLRRARETSAWPDFAASLPVACVDGTLRSRLCGTPAAGRVRAKTGTIAGVRSLAGYATTASGRHVTFAFLLSGASSGTRARQAIDRAVVTLASSRV